MILVEDAISLSPFHIMNTPQHNVPSGGELEDGVVQVGALVAVKLDVVIKWFVWIWRNCEHCSGA